MLSQQVYDLVKGYVLLIKTVVSHIIRPVEIQEIRVVTDWRCYESLAPTGTQPLDRRFLVQSLSYYARQTVC